MIVKQYKGRGRKARVPAVPGQRQGFFYRVYMRWFSGSRRMRL